MYYYRFDLGDFESGCITATRFVQAVSGRLGTFWVCIARDDLHALELARAAAVEEWPPPATRGPLDFIVKFLDP